MSLSSARFGALLARKIIIRSVTQEETARVSAFRNLRNAEGINSNPATTKKNKLYRNNDKVAVVFEKKRE